MNYCTIVIFFCVLIGSSNGLLSMEVKLEHPKEILGARARALVELGKMLQKSRKYTQARECIEEAALQSIDTKCATEASWVLGNIYYRGLGVEKDYEKARKYFERVAHQEEDLESKGGACLFLAHLYYQGHGVIKDKEKAREFLERAGKVKACLKARVRAEWMRLYPVEKDTRNTSDYRVQAGDLQEVVVARAQIFLELGKKLIQSKEYELTLKYLYKFALRYLEQAALVPGTVSGAEASLLLGEIYAGWRLDGLGLKDVNKACIYFEQAAAHQENMKVRFQACLFLGKLHLEERFQIDRNKACLYLVQAAAQKEDLKVRAQAFWYLGETSLYSKFDFDCMNGREYFEQAAAQQEDLEAQAKACLRLGDFWSEVPEMIDLKLARNYYEKARDCFERIESPEAYVYLGRMYQDGYGVEKDEEKARSYFELHASQLEKYDALPVVYLSDDDF